MNKNMLYRSIPKVDVLLEDPEIQGLIETHIMMIMRAQLQKRQRRF